MKMQNAEYVAQCCYYEFLVDPQICKLMETVTMLAKSRKDSQ